MKSFSKLHTLVTKFIRLRHSAWTCTEWWIQTICSAWQPITWLPSSYPSSIPNWHRSATLLQPTHTHHQPHIAHARAPSQLGSQAVDSRWYSRTWTFSRQCKALDPTWTSTLEHPVTDKLSSQRQASCSILGGCQTQLQLTMQEVISGAWFMKMPTIVQVGPWLYQGLGKV